MTDDKKLIPLDDPSVRGVLVDDGEPTKQIVSGRLYRAIGDDYMFEADVEQGHVATYPLQPVSLRPASDFGVAGGERIKELEDLLASETRWAKMYHDNCEGLKADAARLRKAIEHGIGCIKRQGNPVAFSWTSECLYGLQDALSPSPAPAAETKGNAQHHSEGAKIPSGGPGSSAAESKGGEKRRHYFSTGSTVLFGTVDDCRQECVCDSREEAGKLADVLNGHSALSARLAACEERCLELEAGIERHRRDAGTAMPFFTNDTKLWSLLAPKAGGESQA